MDPHISIMKPFYATVTAIRNQNIIQLPEICFHSTHSNHPTKTIIINKIGLKIMVFKPSKRIICHDRLYHKQSEFFKF